MTDIQPTKSVKEEYGSGSDGTPEQALKYAQDTPGQALEAKRLLKLIRNKKMSKTLQIIKKVVEEQRQQSRLKQFSPKIPKKEEDLIGDLIKKTNNIPPLPRKNPRREKQRQYKKIKKQMQTPSYDGPLIPDIRREKHWV